MMCKNIKKATISATLILSMLVASACGNKGNVDSLDGYKYVQELNVVEDNTRTWYELFVYSYRDSDNDGIGDINGVIEKLDYIQEMGFNGIWLMPIMPSPTYHKYDTKNYCDIDPQYGNLEDFKKLVQECHKRDIKLIIDFMMNHTSVQHPWFQEAYTYLNSLEEGKKPKVKDCPYIDYYNFVREEEVSASEYYQVGTSKWYYEGSFWSGMPDLDLTKTAVREEIQKAAKFWLDLGVDGFRIDGVKFFTGSQETNLDILTWFNDYVKGQNKDAYLVTEIWENYNIAAEYLKSGVNSTFDFSCGQSNGAIVKYVRQSKTADVGSKWADTMINIGEITESMNPDSTVAEFLMNHDTGRLKNVLIEEEKIKIGYAMELFMTGNAFVYYGEEIGMSGAGKDENLRAPMYWSATDKTGMTNGPADMESFKNSNPALDEQQEDANSIVNFIKRCIRIRNENPEIARGKIEKIPEVTDEAICAITKTYEDSKLSMLYNLSSSETKTVSLSKDAYGYEGIRGYVSASGEEVTIKGEEITLPPYSIVVLK